MRIDLKNRGLIVLALGLSGLSSQAMAQSLAQDAAVASLGVAAAVQVSAQAKEVRQQAQNAISSQGNKIPETPHSQYPIPQPSSQPSLPPPAVEAPVAAPAPALAAPVASGSTASVPAITTPSLSVDKKDDKKKEDLSSPKIPDSVKSVVKRLNSATEGVTLEDLNSAREAVAKLDILIDIEKRLNDLSKLREEREEKSMIAPIPAKALGLRGGASAPPQAMPVMDPSAQQSAAMPAFDLPQGNVEVVRIIGANGRYAAVVKVGDGKQTTVREGDKVADGSIVQSITNRTVTLVHNKKTRTINVKDIAVVYNGR